MNSFKIQLKDISFSQSLIKQFEKENYCPAKIKAMYIDKTHESAPTLSMDKGNYFEYLCLGINAKGKQTIDLPRKRNNAKTVDQERIEYQAERFPEVLQELGIAFPKPLGRQILITWINEDGIKMEGTLDFVSAMNNPEYGKFEVVVFDLKLTQNLNSTFGDFCWGKPEEMDLLQAYYYPYLFKQHFKEKLSKNFLPPFGYVIFDYKPDPEYKLIMVEYDFDKEREIKERLRYAVEQARRCILMDWAPEPDVDECEKCPVQMAGDCKLNPTIKWH